MLARWVRNPDRFAEVSGAPARASWAAIVPPMAPAPKMQYFGEAGWLVGFTPQRGTVFLVISCS
jgi:hypothetical protein